jgi:hypothetical protein
MSDLVIILLASIQISSISLKFSTKTPANNTMHKSKNPPTTTTTNCHQNTSKFPSIHLKTSFKLNKNPLTNYKARHASTKAIKSFQNFPIHQKLRQPFRSMKLKNIFIMKSLNRI